MFTLALARRTDRPALVVAIKAFAPLVAFLCLDAQGRDRARIESLQADRLASLLAIAVGAVVQTRQCRVDLGNQLALTIASAEFHCALGLRARSIRNIGVLRRFLMQMLQRLFR